MVTAVGVTITGEKVLLGFVQTATENRKVCAAAALRELVDAGAARGGMPAGAVTDGAKGIHAAVPRSSASRPSCSAASGTSGRTWWPSCPSAYDRRSVANCKRR